MDHSEEIANFCAITGAQAHVAEHYLSACEWDLNRGIEFYLENPPDGSGVDRAPQRVGSDPIEIDDDAPAHPAVQGRAIPVGVQAQRSVVDADAEDEEFQRAVAESLADDRARGAQAERTEQAHHPSYPAPRVEFPDEDEDISFLAEQRAAAMTAARRMDEMMDDMVNVTRHAARTRQIAPPPGYPFPPSLMFPQDFPRRAPPASSAQHGPSHPIQSHPLSHGPGGGSGDAELSLPEGVGAAELEEARMLEAALLGVPYHPPPSYQRSAAPNPDLFDPTLVQHRMDREDTDRAYEESLKADRAKAAAAEAAAREAELAQQRARDVERLAAERKEREEREAAEVKSREERSLREVLEAKTRALPAEPSSSNAGAINIMVRLPDGSRQSRRFLRSDPLQAVFDYIDVTCSSTIAPGSYSLVTQYPRKVLVQGTPGSLQQTGVDSDQAFFLELSAASK